MVDMSEQERKANTNSLYRYTDFRDSNLDMLTSVFD